MGQNKVHRDKGLLYEQMGRDQGGLEVTFEGIESPQTNSALANFSSQVLDTSLKPA